MGAKLELVRARAGQVDDSQSQFIDLVRSDRRAAEAEISDGLAQPAAIIAPKYFYDHLGSALFTAICELPEYYPTRTESAIVERFLPQIRDALPHAATLIDLGAGDCAKAARLFDALRPSEYVAVDISSDFVRDAVSRLARQYPAISMSGLGVDFSRELRLPDSVSPLRRVFLYPGSSIGNFTPRDAVALLRQVRDRIDPEGGLLIGVDMVKPSSVLVPAYDDALGVTGAFNLNVLNHVNRLIDANFVTADWQHVALFNELESRIEMHLQARRAVEVKWPGGVRLFAKGERIHTENSYKYTRTNFESMLRDAGLRSEQCWQDDQNWFGVFYARPV